MKGSFFCRLTSLVFVLIHGVDSTSSSAFLLGVFLRRARALNGVGNDMELLLGVDTPGFAPPITDELLRFAVRSFDE